MTDCKQKVESLNDQIAKLKHQIEIEQHRYIRQKNSLKRQIAKERNHRMIFCTGRIEYHLKNRLNIAADEFNNLTDDEVRSMVDKACPLHVTQNGFGWSQTLHYFRFEFVAEA